MGNDTFLFGLFRRRQVLCPTWRGWLVALLVGLVTGWLLMRGIHPFLALHAPLHARVLAVEGWSPDHALRLIADDLEAGRLDCVYVTGVPIDHGAPLSEYETYAELGAAVLIQLGARSNQVHAVPAPRIPRDRTYTSALALKLWLERTGQTPATLDVATVGAHARRSRLLFQKAFGETTRIGVRALPEAQYDPQAWWNYSHGVRAVIGETTAYLYARFWFQADRDAPDLVRTREVRP